MMEIIFSLYIFYNFSFTQTLWKSNKYGYTVEIPKGFSTAAAIGANVDFKAVKDGKSVVIVVRKLPDEVRNLTVWEIFGNLVPKPNQGLGTKSLRKSNNEKIYSPFFNKFFK